MNDGHPGSIEQKLALLSVGRRKTPASGYTNVDLIKTTCQILLIVTWLPLTSGYALSAVTKTEVPSLSSTDRAQINQMLEDYRNAWLSNNRQRILDLFAEDATIIPSGLRPINGKTAIAKFYWPDDGSTTDIHTYDIDVLRIDGDSSNAFTLEHGKLSWSYRKGARILSRVQESFEVTVFRKNADGQWQIAERIWTDLKK